MLALATMLSWFDFLRVGVLAWAMRNAFPILSDVVGGGENSRRKKHDRPFDKLHEAATGQMWQVALCNQHASTCIRDTGSH